MNAEPKVINTLAVTLLDLCRKHPKVGIFIEAHWAEEQCHDFIVTMLSDSHEGTRGGFESDMYGKLMKLYAIHVKMYGDYGRPLTVSYPNLNVHS